MTGSGPEWLDLRGTPFEGAIVQRVVGHLERGGVLAYPTETVYGYGAACDEDGVARVGSLKRRETGKPFIVLLPSEAHAAALAWTVTARELAQVFWPGALTLVLRDPNGTFPPGIRSAEGTVAVRVSPHPLVRVLLEVWDAPIISTSVNAPGGSPARSGRDALRVSRKLGGGRDLLVLDVGTLPPSAPSTVVDCTGSQPKVLRAGSIPADRLACALPRKGGGHG